MERIFNPVIFLYKGLKRMAAMLNLQFLSADELTLLGSILGIILSRNLDKKDLALVGLLFSNLGDVIGTIAAIEAIQSLVKKEEILATTSESEEPINETVKKEDFIQVVSDFREIAKTLYILIDDLQKQNTCLRQEIQELHEKLSSLKQ